MDSASAIAPLIVLGVAGLGLFIVTLAAVLLLRPGRLTAPAAQLTEPQAARTAVDDLPAFHAHPPGSPGAPAARATGGAVPLAPAAVPATARPDREASQDEGLRLARFLLALAALALALIAAAAAVALPSARAARGTPAPPASPASPSSSAADLPAVPGAPAAGQLGAGALAYVSLAPGRGDIDARLSFGALTLEQQAVGVTVTRPSAGVSTSGRQALLHLRLPTWNCLAPVAPDDPVAAGCVPSVTEYGDLPSPALSTSPDGTALVAQGRVPTYTRPNGGAPVYTGQVYDVTLTVHQGRRVGPHLYVADGVLTVGSATAHTDANPALDVLIRGR